MAVAENVSRKGTTGSGLINYSTLFVDAETLPVGAGDNRSSARVAVSLPVSCPVCGWPMLSADKHDDADHDAVCGVCCGVCQ